MASDTERLETNGAETNVHETINDGKLDEATTQASPPDQKKKRTVSGIRSPNLSATRFASLTRESSTEPSEDGDGTEEQKDHHFV